MTDDLFDDPGTAQSIEWNRLNRRLLLIKPLELRVGIQTKHGESDAIRADVHVLPEHGAMQSLPGEVLRNVLIFPKVLQGQVRDNIGTGRFNLGRLGQGVPTKGDPPWMLSDPTDGDRRAAREYLANQQATAPQTPTQGPGNTTFGGGGEPPF